MVPEGASNKSPGLQIKMAIVQSKACLDQLSSRPWWVQPQLDEDLRKNDKSDRRLVLKWKTYFSDNEEQEKERKIGKERKEFWEGISIKGLGRSYEKRPRRNGEIRTDGKLE